MFFKEDVSGDLHSYMPVVPIIHKNNMPDVKNIDGIKRKTKIIGIDPCSASLSSDYSLLDEDNAIITRIMEMNFWNGHEVFMLR